MTDIQLIASDLDGTLLRHDGSLSPRTVAAVKAAVKAGFQMVLASGRPPRTMQPIADQLGLRNIGVCSNGAILYDFDKQAVIENRHVPRDVLKNIILRLKEREPSVCFATEHGHHVGTEPHFPRPDTWVSGVAPKIGDIDTLCAEDVIKLAVHHPDHAVETLAELVRAVTGNELSVTFSGMHFVEVAAAGVSKALGLADVCKRLGVDPKNVVAFGDMPNDLAMLSFVGRGVAVGNAHPDVMAEGYETTGTNDQDGVAQVIEALVAARSKAAE
ncbi:Cof-type HAD-IIB family hydrolase [Dongia sp.]|uniref:Cof-type HAD-IIB family hydrolase n=1 Tax=Dongia sp. TaxID=1977262 RepID=UPI0037501772